MAVRIMRNKKNLNEEEFSFLINPLTYSADEEIPNNPCDKWLPQEVWYKINKLSKLSKKFEELARSMLTFELGW